MKKVLLIVTVIAAFGLTSCKKDYNCTCIILGQTTVSPINNSSKDDAEEACDALDVSAQIVGGSCTLD
ncbi:MAG TPA: hypothetical protein PLD84_15440 [Chitinophagales bacterium]|nr:hypothetical protein [Chitinophagales bacterium]